MRKNLIFIGSALSLLIFVLILYFNFYGSNQNDSETVSQTYILEDLIDENQSDNNMYAETLGRGSFWVYQPIKDDYYIGHHFVQNTNDDFILYSSIVLGTIENNTFSPIRYVSAGSNKEFAFLVKPDDSSVSENVWLPEHNGVGTTFGDNQQLLFDGEEQDLNSVSNFVQVEEVSLSQNLEFIYPSNETHLGNINLHTSISRSGVTYEGTVDWNENVLIDNGYTGMLPTLNPPMESFNSTRNTSYPLNSQGSTEIMQDSELIYFSGSNIPALDNEYTIVLAQQAHDPINTFRDGLMGHRDEGLMWLQHRTSEVQKLYIQVYDDYITEDEEYEFSYSLFSGLSQ